MVKGFYNLTSGMLTQKKNLDVISSNMSNAATIGFKSDRLITSTFQQELMSRTGNMEKSNPEALGDVTMARLPRETVTDFTQGSFRQTNQSLDFAIDGVGFFVVQSGDGQQRYTRNGSFNINADGYLCTQDGDIVMGDNGPILIADPANVNQLNEEKITVDASGRIYNSEGHYVDRFNIIEFDDPAQLVKQDGYFIGGGQGQQVVATIHQGWTEESNVDPLKEMVLMIESERNLQSASQVLKMYDQMLAKATTDIANI